MLVRRELRRRNYRTFLVAGIALTSAAAGLAADEVPDAVRERALQELRILDRAGIKRSRPAPAKSAEPKPAVNPAPRTTPTPQPAAAVPPAPSDKMPTPAQPAGRGISAGPTTIQPTSPFAPVEAAPSNDAASQPQGWFGRPEQTPATNRPAEKKPADDFMSTVERDNPFDDDAPAADKPAPVAGPAAATDANPFGNDEPFNPFQEVPKTAAPVVTPRAAESDRPAEDQFVRPKTTETKPAESKTTNGSEARKPQASTGRVPARADAPLGLDGPVSVLDVLANSAAIAGSPAPQKGTPKKSVAAAPERKPVIQPRVHSPGSAETPRTAELPRLEFEPTSVASTPKSELRLSMPERAATTLSKPELAPEPELVQTKSATPAPAPSFPELLPEFPENTTSVTTSEDPSELPTLDMPAEEPQPVANANSASPANDTPSPQQRQLDERADRDGLLGFCPVTLRDERTLADGLPEFSSMYEGEQYSFASADAKATFDAAPARFVPVNGGRDVVLAAGKILVRGSLRYATYFEDRLYLFRSEQTHRLFEADPSRYVPRTLPALE